MLIGKLESQGLIQPPSWLAANTMFLCQMGSVAYGVEGQASDVDIYGFCVPPKDVVFPHLAGRIEGFGRQQQNFGDWQQHHVKTLDGRHEYDFTVFNIVKFFQLAMENNPNMVDALFVPRRCVLHSTALYERVRDARRTFLHKGSWHKFRGYANSQLSKIRNKQNSSNEKRAATIAAHGYDTKFAYHVVRLYVQIEQIMAEHDLDLQRNSELLKAVRRGEWSLDRLIAWVAEKENGLEYLYATSTLPHKPDEEVIKTLLLECLEMHYGSIEGAIARDVSVEVVVREVQAVLARYAPRVPTQPGGAPDVEDQGAGAP